MVKTKEVKKSIPKNLLKEISSIEGATELLTTESDVDILTGSYHCSGCRSCGGGCYGCKGTSTDTYDSNLKEISTSGLVKKVNDLLVN